MRPATTKSRAVKNASSPETQKEKKEAMRNDEAIALRPPRGMRDILPDDQPYWVHIHRVLRRAVSEFGFSRIQTPVVEFANLFERSVGSETDIVEKEMYTFTSRGGDRLALRPEFTAGIARAFIQYGMHLRPKPVKLFSEGPVFRYDRPQEGRYRELHQADFEIFGEEDAIMDAQSIQAAWRIFVSLGLKKVRFLVNTIGCAECQKGFRQLLVSFLRSKRNKMCQDCRTRLEKNPLRVLDCKEEKCRHISRGAPQSVDHLCAPCHDHFKHLLEYLDELDVPYEISPTLVRGLDYYTRTVFEVIPAEGEGTLSLGGGGRYDNLVEQLGGQPTPAVGFGIGLDRIVLQMKRENTKIYQEPKPRVFLAQLGELAKRKSLRLFSQLEREGILVAESFGRGALKSQMRQAARAGAEITLILGQKEALDETVIMKDMDSGSQETVSQEKIVDAIKKNLKNGVVIRKKK